MNTCLKIVWIGLLLLLQKNAYTQSQFQHRISETTLAITYNKTTSLVFPNTILSVDRGSRDVLAQKAKGVENVLQLKAARQGFPQTNLTVITADGKIHEFTVYYNNDPASRVVSITNNGNEKIEIDPPLIFNTDMTESELEYYSAQIVDARPAIHFKTNSKSKMSLSLQGIYIRENTLFYHFNIRNNSNINYDVDFLRFYVQDNQRIKRTASQEVDVIPIYTYGNTSTINGMSAQDIVFALEKFTIPDAKRLVMEVYEKNGGRHLKSFIKNKKIVKARLL